MGVMKSISNYVKKTQEDLKRMEAEERAEEERAYDEKEAECLMQAEKDLTKLNAVISYIARHKDTSFGKYPNQGFYEKANMAWRLRPCMIEFSEVSKKTIAIENGMEDNFLPDEKVKNETGVYFSKDVCILSIKGSNLGSTDVIIGRDGNVFGVSFKADEQKDEEYDFDSFDVTDCAYDSNPSEKVDMLEEVSYRYVKNLSSTLCQGIISDAYITLGREGTYKKYDDEKALSIASEKFYNSYVKNNDYHDFYDHACECNELYYNNYSISQTGYDSEEYLSEHIDEKGNFIPEGITRDEAEL